MECKVSQDVPVMTSFLSQINSQLEKVREHADKLKEYVHSQTFGAKEGVDLLGLKNQLLLSYMIGLSDVVLAKTSVERTVSLAQHQAVDRLVEVRTVLEKLRPLEARFNYQLDKLLRSASAGVMTGQQHPLDFRPAPHNLVAKEPGASVGGGGGIDSEEDVCGSGVYVPPRMLAVPYKEDTKKQLLTQPRSKSEHHKLLSELRNEWSDLPAEVQTSEENVGIRKGLEKEKAKERVNFEEEYMLRLASRGTGDQRRGDRGQEHLVSDLTDFSMLKGLTRQGGAEVMRKKGKILKRKGTSRWPRRKKSTK